MKIKSILPFSSKVEIVELSKEGIPAYYPPEEKIRTIIVKNFPSLGLLAALRFLEWAQNNRGWTVSLPTGRTPEYFIKWVQFFLNKWDTPEAKKILEEGGVDPGKRPDMKDFQFIQIDEFYPVHSWQENSFYRYVSDWYISGFGFDPARSLLINNDAIGLRPGESLETVWPEFLVDLSLRTRNPANKLEARQKIMLDDIDQFCTEYESKIRSLGGIGFFLGGIGPDGHIGFNVRGSDHYSTTRLCATNYETQAAAAGDLGGMEISRNRLVITIGLSTINFSPNTTAIIIASGEGKAQVVKDAVESDPSNGVPATALHSLNNAAFYVTKGAAKFLSRREYESIASVSVVDDETAGMVIVDTAASLGKQLDSLTKSDSSLNKNCALILKKSNQTIQDIGHICADNFREKIDRGLKIPQGEIFLHTGPHHDDVMLGYLPGLVRLLRDQSNRHFFQYLTSGFTAVTNRHISKLIKGAINFTDSEEFRSLLLNNYFNPADSVLRKRDVFRYLDGLASENREEMSRGESCRFIRNGIEVFKEFSQKEIISRLVLMESYFNSVYPGKKDEQDIQLMKGMVREWEEEILWGYFGFKAEEVIHSRLGFYTGDLFTEEPDRQRDINPIIKILERVNPTIITLAFDPEGSGPDTHYKALQALTEAVKIYAKQSGRNNIKIWGYRNVWASFHPAEANMFIPVTFNAMAIMRDAFKYSYASQAEASFPSYEHDGLFSDLTIRHWVEQYRLMQTLLGDEFFYSNPDSRIRSARGFVFLKEMSLDEFFEKSAVLRRQFTFSNRTGE